MLEAPSLWQLIEARADATPDAQMAVDAKTSITFAGYRDACERAAAGLAGLGVGRGDVVSWQLPTWISSLALVGALARLGCVQNPIIPIYREREVGFIARQARPKLLIVPSDFRGFDFEAMARGIASGVDGLEVVVADESLPEGDPSSLPAPPEPTDDVRWLFYTSGTTAEPKGAKHTDATIAAAARGMSERLELTGEDRNALVFPFTHIGGIIWLYCGLGVGFVNIVEPVFDPAKIVDLLRKERVTIAGAGTPFHMSYLQAQREDPSTKLFPQVRCCPGGGAPKPPQLHYDVKAELGGVGIVSGYGLTEAPILTMADIGDDGETLALTEGRPMPGVELRFVTIDGKPAGPGEEGEIRAKAPQLMKGYLDSALDTEAFDPDGFFRTGDLGRLHPGGGVVITGRLKDVIIRKGENISAKEVEDLLYGHPAVADVAVIGLPDPEVGERACAVVATKDGAHAPDLADIAAFLEQQGLSKQKIPERIELVDVLPRNPAGKVLKQDLRARYT